MLATATMTWVSTPALAQSSAAAARAPADGRTLLLTRFGFTTNQFAAPNLPYKQSALEPLALILVAFSILFVHPSVPANNISD